MAIVYRSSTINAKILRPMISVEHYGLVNLISQEKLAKEFIQEDLTTIALAEELSGLLEPNTNKKMCERLSVVKQKLGSGGASERAAKAILEEIES